MKKRLSILLTALFLGGMSQPAWATVWDVNFSSYETRLYSGPGIVGDSTDTWHYVNDIDVTDYTVLSTDSGISGLLSVDATEKIKNNIHSSLAGWVKGTTSLSFTGDMTVYDVYVFTSSGEVALTAGSKTSIIETEIVGVYNDGRLDYNVYRLRAESTDPHGSTIDFDVSGTGYLNALQIESVAGIPSPEPGTVILLGIGGLLGSLGIKRKYSDRIS